MGSFATDKLWRDPMQLATREQLVNNVIGGSISEDDPPVAIAKTPDELAAIVLRFASSDGWMDRVRLRTKLRWYERVYHGEDHDIWIISWLPGQSTGFHDHGESAGAFVLATGVLEEHRPGEEPRSILPGRPCAFDSDYAHDVRNVSLAPAVSIHAYSPPLIDMNEDELQDSQLLRRESPSGRVAALDQERSLKSKKTANRTTAVSIEEVLSAARSRLRRISPDEAHEVVSATGAILVDIRPESQRAIEGRILGALIVERNVLEWRFDPSSTARLPLATNHDLHVIVFCSEGYTSSLAAAALQDLGLWRATDIVGGFWGWHSAGLPTELTP
jgi:rhodanese-related sulfurtransferase